MDEIFRRKLQRYEVQPGGEVWNRINGHLLSKKKQQKRRLQWKVAASLLVLVAAGSLLIFQLDASLLPGRDHQAMDRLENRSFRNFVREPLMAEQNEVQANPSITSGSNSGLKQSNPEPTGTSGEDKQGLGPAANERSGDAREPVILDKKPAIRPVLPVAETSRPVLAQAQTTSSEFNVSDDISPQDDRQYSALSLKAAMAPVMSFRNVTNNSGPTNFNTSESKLFSYGGGVHFGLEFSPRLTVRSGLYYSQMGQTLSKILLGADDFARRGDQVFVKLNNSLGEVRVQSQKLIKAKPPESFDRIADGSSLRKFSYTMDASVIQRFEYLRIPLMLEYTVIDRRMDVNLVGGLHSNFLVNEGVYLKTKEGNTQLIGNTASINRFNYSGSVGLGLEYTLASHVNMYFEPTMDYFLNPINQDETKTYPYSFAVYTGLSISF
jgi:hypothetical protein